MTNEIKVLKKCILKIKKNCKIDTTLFFILRIFWVPIYSLPILVLKKPVVRAVLKESLQWRTVTFQVRHAMMK